MSQVIELVIKDLSSVFGKNVILKGMEDVGGGCIHHATRLDTSAGHFFLKWNAQCAMDMFMREAECLQELKKANPEPLIIPEVIRAKPVDNTPGYLLLEYLTPGITAHDEEKLGQGLANLHRFQGNGFGYHIPTYCGLTLQENGWHDGWPHFFSIQRIAALVSQIRNRGGFNNEQLSLFDKLTERIPGLLPAHSEASLIHGDLWSGNFMLTSGGPALIDPASYYADREMEMGIMTMFGGFSTRFWSAYQESYPLPPEWKSRNRLYQLYHVLNHYLLFGGGYGNTAVSIARSYV